MINTATVLRAFLIITLSITLISCGGGGDSAPVSSTTPDPAINSNWEQMEWDKGTWSN